MGKTVTTTAVLKINGKEIQNTWSALYKETKKLEKELKKLPHESEEFIKKSKELDNVKKHFKQVDDSIKSTNISLEEGGEHLAMFLGGLSSGNIMQAKAGLLALTSNLKGLLITLKAVALTPIGIFVSIFAGIAIGTKKWLDYNKALIKTTKLTKQLTQLTGQALTEHRDTVTAISKQNDKSFEEILKGANSLSKQMNISQQEALELLNQGFIRGADINGDFLDKVKEYPIHFKNAGYSAQDFIDVATQEVKGGVYNDKLLDAIKESDLALKELTKTQEDALKNAFGDKFTQTLKKGLASGEITTKQAIDNIIKESNRVGLNHQQQQQLIADIWKGAGEDVGGFNEIIKQLNASFDEGNKQLTDLEKATLRVTEANVEYEKAVSNLFDATQSDFPVFLESWKAFGTEVLTGILTTFDRIITSQDKLLKRASDKGSYKAAETIADNMKLFGSDAKKEAEIEIIATEKNIKRLEKDLANVGWELIGNKKEILTEKIAEYKAYQNELVKITKGTSGILDKILKQRKEDEEKGKGNGNSTGGKITKEKKDNTLEKTLEEQKKANRRLLELEHELQKEKLQIKKDSLNKEVELIELDFKRQIEKIKQGNLDIQKEIENTNSTISSFQKRKANTKDPKKRAQYNTTIKALHQLNNKRIEIKKENDAILIQLESTKQYKIAALREKWFVKDLKSQLAKINKEKELEVDRINTISTYEEAVQKLKNDYGIKDLSTVRNITEAKNKLREEANKKALDQQIKFLEVQSALLEKELEGATGPAAEQLKKNLQFLEEKLTKIRGVLQGKSDDDELAQEQEQQQALEQTDILGFSAAQWLDTFDNLDTTEGKLQAVGMAMQALANAGRMFAEHQRANNEKELRDFTKYQERRKKALEKKLDSGLITQEKYQKEVEKLEIEAANKKAELEYKQAKANKVANLFEAMGSTAVAVATALKAGGVLGPILAGIVGALGAVQIGLIASQPLPPKASYASGGFTKGLGFKDETGHEVAGAVHANEYVIPEWLLAQPKVANVAKWLEAKRTNKNESFAEGGSATDIETLNSQSPDTNSYSNDTNIMLLYAVNRLNDVLENIEDNGIEAFLLSDEKNGKLMHEAIKKFNTIQDKNKQ